MESFKDLLAKAVAGTSAKVTVAPLKAQARVLEKARDDYLERRPGPPVSYVYDVLRGSILCPDERAILHVIEFLLHGPETSPPEGGHGEAAAPAKKSKPRKASTEAKPPEREASTAVPDQKKPRVLRLKNRFQNPTAGASLLRDKDWLLAPDGCRV